MAPRPNGGSQGHCISSDDILPATAIHHDVGLETLLELDGSVLEQEDGFWIKIDVKVVEASEQIPHGVRYSLPLHDKHGTRVLGYDHAHAVKLPKKFKLAGRRVRYDHLHRTSSDRRVPYLFESPQRLLEVFFAEVDRVIREAGK